PEPRLWSPPPPAASRATNAELVSSLIPYSFDLLDARSGYPAGIRDPAWQQRLWQTLRDGGDVAALVAACLVEITRGVRARGLPAPRRAVPAAHLRRSLCESPGVGGGRRRRGADRGVADPARPGDRRDDRARRAARRDAAPGRGGRAARRASAAVGRRPARSGG